MTSADIWLACSQRLLDYIVIGLPLYLVLSTWWS